MTDVGLVLNPGSGGNSLLAYNDGSANLQSYARPSRYNLFMANGSTGSPPFVYPLNLVAIANGAGSGYNAYIIGARVNTFWTVGSDGTNYITYPAIAQLNSQSGTSTGGLTSISGGALPGGITINQGGTNTYSNTWFIRSQQLNRMANGNPLQSDMKATWDNLIPGEVLPSGLIVPQNSVRSLVITSLNDFSGSVQNSPGFQIYAELIFYIEPV
jgi:hypothetical protein